MKNYFIVHKITRLGTEIRMMSRQEVETEIENKEQYAANPLRDLDKPLTIPPAG